jgi:hypothetical protein
MRGWGRARVGSGVRIELPTGTRAALSVICVTGGIDSTSAAKAVFQVLPAARLKSCPSHSRVCVCALRVVRSRSCTHFSAVRFILAVLRLHPVLSVTFMFRAAS